MAKKSFLTVRKVIPLIIIVSFITILIIFLIRVFRKNPGSPGKLPRFLQIETNYYVYDDVVGHLHKPRAKVLYFWPEHNKGKIIMVTNSLGFREDSETSEKKPAGITRILVTGDSHLDGVVYNDESFPNQLENLLNRGDKKPGYECINGGVGHYGPNHYSAFLKRFLYLKPDVFIVVLYTGNDFLDTIYFEEFNGRFQIPQRPRGYFDKILAADEKLGGSSAQSLNQVFFFKTFPGLKDKAIEVAKTHFKLINQMCKDNGIDWLVVLLPTKLDIEFHMDSQRIMAASKILQLSEKDFGINRQMTELLISWLSDEKINFIDLYARMKKKQRKLFWKKDHHLNNRGHKNVARIIYNSSYRSLLTEKREK